MSGGNMSEMPASAVICRLAAMADCDPRTIRRALRGDYVRGRTGERVRGVLGDERIRSDLALRGLIPPEAQKREERRAPRRDRGDMTTARALLKTKHAAVYIDLSASYLNQLRAADAKRLQRGERIEGPEWVVLGRCMVRYTVTSLDKWIARVSVPMGSVESKRRNRGSLTRP